MKAWATALGVLAVLLVGPQRAAISAGGLRVILLERVEYKPFLTPAINRTEDWDKLAYQLQRQIEETGWTFKTGDLDKYPTEACAETIKRRNFGQSPEKKRFPKFKDVMDECAKSIAREWQRFQQPTVMLLLVVRPGKGKEETDSQPIWPVTPYVLDLRRPVGPNRELKFHEMDPWHLKRGSDYNGDEFYRSFRRLLNSGPWKIKIKKQPNQPVLCTLTSTMGWQRAREFDVFGAKHEDGENKPYILVFIDEEEGSNNVSKGLCYDIATENLRGLSAPDFGSVDEVEVDLNLVNQLRWKLLKKRVIYVHFSPRIKTQIKPEKLDGVIKTMQKFVDEQRFPYKIDVKRKKPGGTPSDARYEKMYRAEFKFERKAWYNNRETIKTDFTEYYGTKESEPPDALYIIYSDKEQEIATDLLKRYFRHLGKVGN